jgi:ACS family hexuronate transporter-like MFS transporter
MVYPFDTVRGLQHHHKTFYAHDIIKRFMRGFLYLGFEPSPGDKMDEHRTAIDAMPTADPRAQCGLFAGRYRFAILGVNALVLILNYGDRAAIGIAAPLIMAEFGFSKATMGIILSAFAVSYAPACFGGGWLADRFGPRKVMAGAALIWSLFTAATAFCVNLPSFIVQRLLFGLGEGPQGSVTARTMSNWFPQREYATAVGLTFAANPLGAAIGTPLVAWILYASGDNWRIPFLVLGGLGVVIAAVWYLTVRDWPAQHPRVTEEEVKLIGRKGDLANDASAQDDTNVPPLSYYLKQTAVWGNALAFFGFSWILFMFLSWYPVFLLEQHHVDLKSLAWSGAMPWIAGSLGTALGGIFSDRILRRTQNAFSTRKWIAVVCLALGALLCIPLAVLQTTVGAVALLTLTLFILYISNAQFFALVKASVHPKRLGSVTGFVHFCANSAAFIAPAVTGFVVQGLKSWSLAFGLAAALALAGAFVLALARPPRVTATMH